MSAFRIFMISVCVSVLAAGAFAQDAKTEAPPKPMAESFIKYIPAGTMGFIATNNLEVTIKHVEKYLADIGADELMNMDLEQSPGALMDLLKMSARFGEGFNPNGGVIIMMLDPEQFEINLPQAVEDDKMPEKLPFVAFIPGSSVEEVFGGYTPEKDGDYTKLTMPMGEMMAAQCGDYVMLSPMKEALQAVLEAKVKAADKELTKKQIELFEKSDISIYINMRVAGPIFSGMIKAYEKAQEKKTETSEYVSQQEKMFATALTASKDIISQLDAFCLTGRITDEGVVFDGICDWTPDSDFGKALAAFKAPSAPLLSRVPDMSYFIAIGAGGQSDTTVFDVQSSIKSAIKNMKLEEEQAEQAEKLAEEWTEEVNGMQFVAGQGVQDSSLIGLTLVIDCKDADKTRKLLAETAAFAAEVITFQAASDTAAETVVSYDEGVETIGDMKIDAISITNPKMESMSDEERNMMVKIIGEDKMRILVASPDKNTVVLTFGGATAYMEKALETVRQGKGSVLANEDVRKSLEHMPKNACFLFMGNAGNLFKTVGGIMEASMGQNILPFEITCQTPLAVGVAVEGTSTHLVAFVPTTLVKECIDAYKKVQQQKQEQYDNGDDGSPMDEGEDF